MSTLEVVGPRITRVRADNAGPMTLDGTNTWVLRALPDAPAVVVDPGPADEAHLRAVAGLAPVALIVLTHRHADHSAGAARLAALTGAPVTALDPRHATAGVLVSGGRTGSAGVSLRVLGTPGHSSDSVSFVLDAAPDDPEAALLTGDTVLGWGTTVVAHPDGRLDDYLASLVLLRAAVDETGVRRILPGHGPVVTDPAGVLDHYLAHRAERLDQVRAAVAAGDRTPQQVVARVYADVDRALWPAAALSVRAQLDHLRRLGELP